MLGVITALLFYGCKKQKIPAFVQINDFQLVQNPSVPNSVEGMLTSEITNVLVYVNGNNLGYYELPIKIPILEEGVTNISLFPAVQQNGISGTIIDYPFYKTFDTTLNLIPEAEYEITPTTMYKDNISSWIMDFEGATTLNSEPNSMVDMVKIAPTDTNGHHIVPAINGSGVGWVRIDQTDSLWNARTNSLVNPSGRVWLELDYKITNSVLNTFIAGQSGGEDEFPYLFLTPSAKGSEYWKKIYIDLTENVSFAATANYYEAGFTAVLDNGLTDADVCLDNIKILYFQ